MIIIKNKGIKSIFFLTLFVLSSCASHRSNTVCPTFGSNKTIRVNKIKENLHLNMSGLFSFKKKRKSENKGMVIHIVEEKQLTGIDEIYFNNEPSIEANSFPNLAYLPLSDVANFGQSKSKDTIISTDLRVKKKKFILLKNKIENIITQKQETKMNEISNQNKSDDAVQQKSKRRTAKIIGGALLLMAILSGIAIPALGTLTASIGLVGIFLLDIFASYGIYKYHKKEKPKLAKSSSLLRLLYTAIFGVGIGYHIAGNVPMFNKMWGIGLIIFGIHLITLGILFNNEGRKKWVNILIKSLLILAGIGYIIQYLGILLVPNPVGFAAIVQSIFIGPMILGEVFYGLWMLIKGGKLRN